MKAILLARVSTEEQKEAGNSLPSQLTRLQKYCVEHDLNIVNQYDFDESAWKTNRTGFKEIVDVLKKSKEKMALCCDKIDRLIRNFSKDLVIIEELRKQGKIELHFPSDNIVLHKDSPATDLFRFTIGVSLAKYYSDSISDNVKRAYENKIRKGEWIGKAPFGYITVQDESGKRNMIPDPTKSSYVKRIFELYSTGNYSLSKIQGVMKKYGLKHNDNSTKTIGKNQIFAILQNPFYYGFMRIKNTVYPHKYHPLIRKELFDEVQKVMSGWERKPFAYQTKKYIFRGLIKCAECGCTISPETQKGHIYYSCTNSRKVHRKKVYVTEIDLLKPIYEVLEGISLTNETIHELVEDLKSVNRAEFDHFMTIIQDLQQEYNQLEINIDKLTELRFKGKITEDFYLQRITKLAERQKKILWEIDIHDDADKDYHITANTILNLAQRAKNVFESSETEEKRNLLNFIFQNCELNGKKLQYQLKSPFDTILKASTCTSLLGNRDSNPD